MLLQSNLEGMKKRVAFNDLSWTGAKFPTLYHDDVSGHCM